MKTSITFPLLLQAEVYKLLHNRHAVALALSPLVISLLMLLFTVYKSRAGLFDETHPTFTANPWLMLWGRYTLPLFSLLLPPLVVTLSYITCDIEFRNDNIRMLFAFPIAKWRLYLSKVSAIAILISILIATTGISFVLGGYLLGALLPAYQFADHPVWIASAQVAVRTLLAAFSVGALGLLISLLSRSFTMPILLACFFTGIAVFVTNENIGQYLPFVTFTYIASIHPIEDLTTFAMRDISNILWGIATLLAGFLFFSPEKKI